MKTDANFDFKKINITYFWKRNVLYRYNNYERNVVIDS